MSGKGVSRRSACSMEWPQTQFEGLLELGPLLGSCLYKGCCSLAKYDQTSAGWWGLAGPGGAAAAADTTWASRKAGRAAPASCWYWFSWILLRPESLRGGSQCLSAVMLVSLGPLQSWQEWSQDTSGPGAAILSSISTGILGCGQSPERTSQNNNQLLTWPGNKQNTAGTRSYLCESPCWVVGKYVAHDAVKWKQGLRNLTETQTTKYPEQSNCQDLNCRLKVKTEICF